VDGDRADYPARGAGAISAALCIFSSTIQVLSLNHLENTLLTFPGFFLHSTARVYFVLAQNRSPRASFAQFLDREQTFRYCIVAISS
jgi:hypothetical protein